MSSESRAYLLAIYRLGGIGGGCRGGRAALVPNVLVERGVMDLLRPPRCERPPGKTGLEALFNMVGYKLYKKTMVSSIKMMKNSKGSVSI